MQNRPPGSQTRISSFVLRSWAIAVLLWALTITSPGLSPEVPLSQFIREQWQTEKGLPQNSVYDMVQDRDGFLWLGTEAGLVRFDGARFDVFDNQFYRGKFHNYVYRILLAKDGALWIGTRGGGVFEICEGEIKRNFSMESGLSNNDVYALAQGKDGAIWIGTRNGLNRYFKGEMRHFTRQDGLPSNVITALYADAGGEIWVGTEQAGLASYDGVRFTRYSAEQFQLQSDISGIVEDRSGTIWVALDGDGLFRFVNGSFEFVSVLPDAPVQNIQRLYLDNHNVLWVATQFNGVVRVQEGSLQNLNREKGLSQDHVVAFLQDQEGSLWIGTAYGGLNRLREGLVRTFAADEGLLSERITCMAEAPDGTIYVGTYHQGLFRFKNGQFTPVYLEGFNTKLIRTLIVSRDGTVWAGSGGGGLFALTRTGQKRFTMEEGLLSNDVNVVYEDSGGYIWMGLGRKGLTRLDPEEGSLMHFEEGPLQGFIRAIIEEQPGVLLLATQSAGLIQLKEGQLSTVIDPVESGAIRSLARSDRGGIWVGTRDKGIMHYSRGQFVTYDSRHGLREEQICHLLEAGEYLWFSSSLGIERLRTRALLNSTSTEPVVVQAFNEVDGMRTSQINANGMPVAIEAKDGKLWFATERGLCLIDPKAEKRSPPAKVLIQGVYLDQQPVAWKEGLNLAPGVNRLHIEYTSPSLGIPSRVKFRVKLDGADKEWVEAGFRREAIYHNLKPGNYVFRVQASDDSGDWSEQEAKLALQKSPHFYQTLWFAGLVVLSTVATMRGAISWRTRSIKARAARLEELVRQRTEELTAEVDQRKHAQEDLRSLNEALEERIYERTSQLNKAFQELQLELSEREKAEAARSESESRLRRVVESGMVGVLFWEREGGITEANDTFLQMLGYTRGELQTGLIRWDQITPPEHLDKDRAALEEIASRGVCSPFEKEYLHKDGHRVPVLLGAAAFSNTRDEGVCFVLDITSRKQAEEEIRKLNQGLETRVVERTSELARANERLAREVSERKRVAVALEAFSQLGKKLQPTRTEREAARIIAETAQALVGWDACTLDIYGHNEKLATVLELPPPGPQREGSLASTISVPMRYEDRTIGILTLHKKASNAFTTADSSSLQSLSDYCSGALQRIHTEEARRESERRFTAFMNNTPAMAWLKDSRFRYIYGNQTFLRKLPKPLRSLEGKTDYDLWPAKIAAKLRANDEQALALGRTYEAHETVPGLTGEMQTWLVFKFPFVGLDGQQFVGGMAVDVTEQKRAEDALHKFPQKILDAQEGERRRVARELHDSVQQVLSSILFRVQNTELQMRSGSDRWGESLTRTKQLLNSAMDEVKRIGRNLRPSELDDIGLVAAIESTLREFATRTSMQIQVDTSGYDRSIPKLLESTLYRIVQEALNNIEKHSGATHVDVTLACDETYVTLHVTDNGKGFVVPTEDGSRLGMGLLNMKERASSVGGLISIKASPGAGVQVSIYLPLAAAMPKDHDHHVASN